MTIQDLLSKIRSPLIQRVSQTVARGSGLRESFEAQLERFLDLLDQVVLTGDTAWIDPILHDWAKSPTETDLEAGQYNVASLMNRITGLTIEVARESLNEQDALSLISAVVPIYTHGLEVVTRYEMETRVAHITSEMAALHKNMEQLNRSKSNFISVAAHELKTPLTLIEGYSAMLSDIAAGKQEAGMHELLQGVSIGILRLRQIIDDMIDVSLIDNQLLTLNLQPLQLSQLFERLQSDFEETIRARNQRLEFKDFEGCKVWIYADPERVHQALKNVLLNAIKFTPDAGWIRVDGRSLPGFLEVTVTDSGIGISIEDQSLIFEKFGQLGRAELHSSGKTKFKGGGPGLGLAIARGIIETHGGSIWVESMGYDETELPGSTFHILLPSRNEQQDARVTKLFARLEASKTDLYGKKETRTDHTAP